MSYWNHPASKAFNTTANEHGLQHTTTMSAHDTPVPPLRRTRFVLISDTHNATPHLPRGDVLIHAGDITNRGTHAELSRSVQWLEKADFEAKIIIAGKPTPLVNADHT